MKIERTFTSGTGNGINKEHYKEFVEALEKEIKLMQKFVQRYKKVGAERMFGGSDMYALNNWHGEYKIEVYADSSFPFDLVNRVGFNSWGDIELGIVIPMKFKAPTFHGGETDNMKVVFKTHCTARNFEKFVKEYNIKPNIEREILLCAQEYFQNKVKDYTNEKKKHIESRLKSIKDYESTIQNIQTSVEEDTKHLKTIDKLLNK